MVFRFVFILACIMSAGCAGKGSHAPGGAASASDGRVLACELTGPWELRFFDGSNNKYLVGREGAAWHFAFEPTKPLESSSGVYDGGEPQKGSLKAGQVHAIVAQVQALVADPALRSEHRAMGTGMFKITTPTETCGFIIVMGDRLNDFVSFLRKEMRLQR